MTATTSPTVCSSGRRSVGKRMENSSSMPIMSISIVMLFRPRSLLQAGLRRHMAEICLRALQRRLRNTDQAFKRHDFSLLCCSRCRRSVVSRKRRWNSAARVRYFGFISR